MTDLGTMLFAMLRRRVAMLAAIHLAGTLVATLTWRPRVFTDHIPRWNVFLQEESFNFRYRDPAPNGSARFP